MSAEKLTSFARLAAVVAGWIAFTIFSPAARATSKVRRTPFRFPIRSVGADAAMVAVSRLAPPASERDDHLVWAYLGYLLGVDPDQVPRPTTSVAGHRSLEYFDPPIGKGAKPTLVGGMPWAVFGQTDRDGLQHAHRIYLALGGQR